MHNIRIDAPSIDFTVFAGKFIYTLLFSPTITKITPNRGPIASFLGFAHRDANPIGGQKGVKCLLDSVYHRIQSVKYQPLDPIALDDDFSA